MSSIQKGTFGVAWSLGASMTGTGVGTHVSQSTDYGRTSELKKIKTADGETACMVFFDQMETLTIEVVPSGATKAAAKTANVLPAIGADVTLTDADDAQMGTGPASATTWHFLSGTKRRTVDGESRMTFTLARQASNLAVIS